MQNLCQPSLLHIFESGSGDWIPLEGSHLPRPKHNFINLQEGQTGVKLMNYTGDRPGVVTSLVRPSGESPIVLSGPRYEEGEIFVDFSAAIPSSGYSVMFIYGDALDVTPLGIGQMQIGTTFIVY